MRTIRCVILHCADTPPEWMAGKPLADKVAEIRLWHMSPPRRWSDIGYHYVVDRDGAVAPGRPESRVGAHTLGHNKDSIGVCLIGGRLSSPTDPPEKHFTARQLAETRRLVDALTLRYPGATVHGHNEFAARACPGFDARAWWAGSKEPGLCPVCNQART